MSRVLHQNYKMCVSCVMDTSDPDIIFDKNGVCNHCKNFENNAKKIWDPSDQGKQSLDEIIAQIRKKNKKRRYDCILGISGGMDSSYLALILKEYDLRVLAVHVDGGWNSELAVSNIQKIISHCNFDLYTHVVDWDEMRDLQLAYFKSGISNLDVPQDHVFFAVLHKQAIKNNCNIFMSGGNVASEFVFPPNWHGDAMDAINLKDINRRYGKRKLKHYETISFLDWNILFRLRGFKQIRPLNYLPYEIDQAAIRLGEIGWRIYPRKHGESIFTKFFQNYFLPNRFGYDKRKPHLSSRILSGQISRNQALDILKQPLYDDQELLDDKKFVSKKLGISVDELDSYISIPKKYYSDYKNWSSYKNLLDKAKKIYLRFLNK